MAKVREIQSCGGKIFQELSHGCYDYLDSISNGTDRPKLNFAIECDDGVTRQITIRQTDNGIEVYGDFEGMPDFVEWCKKHCESAQG